MFIGSTGTRGDRAAETVDAINKEVRRMAEDGPTRQELDEAKSYLKGSQMLALDTSSKLASALLQYQLDKLGIDYIEKRNAVVEAVTMDQVKHAARRLWGQGLQTVIVGRAPEAGRPACLGGAGSRGTGGGRGARGSGTVGEVSRSVAVAIQRITVHTTFRCQLTGQPLRGDEFLLLPGDSRLR